MNEYGVIIFKDSKNLTGNGVFILVGLMFREHGTMLYETIPAWVESMIWLGYKWILEDKVNCRKRRIALISMPCESVVASLIALGILRRELELTNANVVDGYFDYLISNIEKLQLHQKEVIVLDQKNKKWKLSGINDAGSIRVVDANYRERKGKRGLTQNGPVYTEIIKSNATKWRVEGQPSAITDNPLDRYIYENIPRCDGEILDLNLKSSWLKSLLLVDAESIGSRIRKRIDEVWFECDTEKKSLSDLLTLNNKNINRLAFSSRKNINLCSTLPIQIITDGSHSFLKALDHFKDSDVIGVISRDEPIGNLQSVSDKLNDMVRYYQESEYQDFTDCLPRSISARFMEKR